MQAALRVTTTVLTGNRLEVTAPELREGETVEVFVILPETPPLPRPSSLDIIEGLAGAVTAAGKVAGQLNTTTPTGDALGYDSTLSPGERARLLEEWADGHERGAQPLLSDDALRREALYAGTGGDR